MLVAHNWQWIDLQDLITSELSTFRDVADQRFTCSGPALTLPSDLDLSLGLAIHEMTTNSVKCGALSVAAGHVNIAWSVSPVDDDQVLVALEFEWIERNGPEVCEPGREGFASKLMQRLFAAQCGGYSKLEYHRSGLAFHAAIRLPAASDPAPLESRIPLKAARS